ncbi:cilia- and flagella-associated protein 157 isoform X3 [Ornithorhynchus anatinus]|uniref:cilia- and flagella-associated protein 157 isoform X3 n=1 Tax=Ornithorhynchus anatinus TaxID=9258 RepID=UPI0010A79941|nr:cilia- and flagella-associated protein 157 isoform X3 [Ornithorhynchus anatinus]
MPPKDGEKGRKGSKEPNPLQKPPEEPLTEVTREFYLIQIRDLESRLARYQRRWDELVVEEKLFRLEFEQLANNKKEIVAFLKRTLNQRVDEITDLNEQLQGLQLSKEAEKDAFEAQLAQVRHEFQETKDQLTSENMVLGGKLAALDDFRLQKEELMAQFALLEEQLKKQELEYKEHIYHLEKKAVLDKDNLKKEIIQRVNTVASEFRKISSSQMAETTKRAIRENMRVTLQLANVSSRSLALMQENEQLHCTAQEMRKELVLLQHMEKAMAKDGLGNKKMIQLLSEKCREQQQGVEEAHQLRKELGSLKVAFERLQSTNQALRKEVKRLEEEVEQQREEGQRLNQELDGELKQRQNLEQVLAQATYSLKDILSERPPAEDGHFDVRFQLRRNELLQRLLSQLSKIAAARLHVPEFVPPPAVEPQEQSPPQSPLGPLLQQLSRVVHYRPGDLGLIPRPLPPHLNPHDIALLSRTSRLGPLQASVASQNSVPPHKKGAKQGKLPALPRPRQ